MKNLFVLLLILPIFVIAQVPDYFANNPVWIGNSAQSGLWGPGCIQTYNFMHYIEGDTIIGQMNYKKLYRRGWHKLFGSTCSTPNTYFVDDPIFIRQQDRKIYFLFGSTEYLYFNYELNVGDTLDDSYNLSVSASSDTSTFIVQAIDSILMGSEYRRRFHFQYFVNGTPYYEYDIVEGIGIFTPENNQSGLGLTNSLELIIPMLEYSEQLDCYSNDIGYLYSGICDTSPFDFTLSSLELEKSDFELFPNPNTGSFEVKGVLPNSLVSIYSSSGQLVHEDRIASSNKYFDLNLDKGIYLVKVLNENGAQSEKRIVVE